MRSVNRLTILGNVGSINVFNGCIKVSIATNRSWTGEDGQRRERTDWVPVTVFEENQRKWIEENIAKGDTVYVEARVAQTSYGEGDARQYTVDVVANLFNKL
ncbi:single-stranded DNA-binding protein [Aureimonas pseudogalii]|uniref:Plasmid-derived single-stranded DNA-binding protein n=1 Tax=Aureimonas pseudogalii TaxID=1744844 RepID=A0A7W6MLT0_9HYPH|nr:single-stranded DNA-binding protein [Aureimonas pseudogalii]MBB4000125.1 single stranded DNA-binding protein [Aureimonas pseudogalii]